MLNKLSPNDELVVNEEEYARMAKERRSRSYGIADLHIHSSAGDGMASVQRILEYVQYHTSLNLIAITDHDLIDGALEAQDLVIRKNYDFQVIVGSEITSAHGHVLALFLKKPVRSLQSLAKTISDIHEQGGLCIIPHPFSWLTRSVGRRTFEKVLGEGLRIDGIETCNASIAGKVKKDQVLRLNAERYRLPETGGSDAHFLPHIGSAYTVFEGRTKNDLLGSMKSLSTRGTMDKTMVGKVAFKEFIAQQIRSLLVLPARQVRKNFRELTKGSVT